MTWRDMPDRFLVAFTFSGDERGLIEPLVSALEERLGSGTVFYDRWFEHYIAGTDADARLQHIYAERADLVVVGVSASYGTKPWTLTEHEAVRSLTMRLRQSGDPKDALRMLPLRVGDGDVRGIPFNAICPDIRDKPVGQTVELILNRLRLVRPSALGPLPGAMTRADKPCVFLAECTPDLDDPSRPVNRHRIRTLLLEKGWDVLPAAEYEAAHYASQLKRDIERCSAFVQLLGPYAWKRGGYDRLQFEAAASCGLRRFVYRSDDIDLAKVEPPSHREFLASREIIASGFDDFLVHLETELGRLAERAGPSRSIDDNPPLVRVAIRTTNPDPLWDQVFQWIYLQEHLLSDQLAADESFESKHQVEPCQGFLIVCDARAMEDGPHSPRRDMEQCRLIQIREKNAARRPPVALVYWPPPEPSWARLLRSVPQKLHCAQVNTGAGTPAELDRFFAEVRRVDS